MLYKFRSTKVNADADQKRVSCSNRRITPVGRFLRKSSLDELPQFINVLIRNISVVGPRPHMLKHTRQYRQVVRRFMLRHTVKSRITGLVQAHGYRGEIGRISEIKNRVSFDVKYFETWSFGLDLKIIFLTICNLFRG